MTYKYNFTFVKELALSRDFICYMLFAARGMGMGTHALNTDTPVHRTTSKTT